MWTGLLPEPSEALAHVVRRYLAGYGPATRQDIEQFTGYRLGQIDPALEGMREVDGLVAGSWRMDGSKLRIEPFAPLPLRMRREVDAEGERLRAFHAG